MTEPRKCEMYIDGRFGNVGVTQWLDVVNPSTEQIVAYAPDADQHVVDTAVAAATHAFTSWRWVNAFERSRVFFFNDTATTEIYTLSLLDALPISASTEGSGHSITSTARSPRELNTSTVVPDRKSTRLNSSHTVTSYAVFCLK